MEKVSQKKFIECMCNAKDIRRSFLPAEKTLEEIVERVSSRVVRYCSEHVVISALRSRGLAIENDNGKISICDLNNSKVYYEFVSDVNGHVYAMYVVDWGYGKVAYFIR